MFGELYFGQQEFGGGFPPIQIFVSDNETVTDAVVYYPDTLYITESVTIVLPATSRSLSVSDSETVTENVNINTVDIISVNESETVTEKSLVGIGGIAFDSASSSGYEPSLSTYSWTHTVYPGDKNEILIVGVSLLVAGTVSNVKYNGVTLTFLMATTNGIYRTEVWYLLAPSSGANNVQVNLSTSLTSIANAVSYAAVDQVTPIESDSGNTGLGNPASDTVTTDTINSLVLDFLTTSATAVTPGSGQTSRSNNTGALGSGAVSSKGPSHDPSTVSVSWNGLGSLDLWADTAIALSPLLSVALENLFDAETVTENVNLQIVSFINVNETETVSENVNVNEVDTINVNDVKAVTENVNIIEVDTINVNDLDGVTDVVSTFVITLPIVVNDSETTTENVNINQVDIISVNDVETVTESVSLKIIITINVSETETTSESVSVIEVDTISVSDVGVVTEAVTLRLLSFISVNDLSPTTDNITIQEATSISVSDADSPTESIQLLEISDILVSETETITESVSLVVRTSIQVSDSEAVTESVSVKVTVSVSVSDNETVTDIVSGIEVFSNDVVFDQVTITEFVAIDLPKSIGTFVIMNQYNAVYLIQQNQTDFTLKEEPTIFVEESTVEPVTLQEQQTQFNIQY